MWPDKLKCNMAKLVQTLGQKNCHVNGKAYIVPFVHTNAPINVLPQDVCVCVCGAGGGGNPGEFDFVRPSEGWDFVIDTASPEWEI